MLVYRITGKKYAGDLSGAGAALFGGRWNKKGRPVLYTGESIEIALLEALVHVPPMMIPEWDLLTIEIPSDSVSVLETEDLPDFWNHYPAPHILSDIGEKWILENKTLALKVPSSVLYTTHNYILNCAHPLYTRIKPMDRQSFELDRRLIRPVGT